MSYTGGINPIQSSDRATYAKPNATNTANSTNGREVVPVTAAAPGNAYDATAQFAEYKELMVEFMKASLERDETKLKIFFERFDDFIWKVYSSYQFNEAKFLCIFKLALYQSWRRNPINTLTTPSFKRESYTDVYRGIYDNYLYNNSPLFELYPAKYAAQMDSYPISLTALGLTNAELYSIIYWLTLITYYPELNSLFVAEESVAADQGVNQTQTYQQGQPNYQKRKTPEHLFPVVYPPVIWYLAEFDGENSVSFFMDRLKTAFNIFKPMVERIQQEREAKLKANTAKAKSTPGTAAAANSKVPGATTTTSAAPVTTTTTTLAAPTAVNASAQTPTPIRKNLVSLMLDDFYDFARYSSYENCMKHLSEGESYNFATDGKDDVREIAYKKYSDYFDKLIEEARKISLERKEKLGTNENSLATRYDYSVGRKDSWVSSNMRSMFKPNGNIIFRSPQFTLREVYPQATLKKPLVYLLGSSYEQIVQQEGATRKWVAWRLMFESVLSSSCYVFPVQYPEGAVASTDAIRAYDDFCSQIALLSADFIIVYIDGAHRNIDVIIQALFLIISDFPVVIIVEDIPIGKYPESDDKLNEARKLVKTFAEKRSVPVFTSFTEFSHRFGKTKNGNRSIDVDEIMRSVGGHDAERVRQNIDSLSALLRHPTEYQDISKKSILYSRRPIFRRVMVDVDDKLVESDKIFTFSILNSFNVAEYFALLNFAYFNDLGSVTDNIKISPNSDMRFRTDFQELKGIQQDGTYRHLNIQFLDTTFYRAPEYFEEETIKALKVPLLETSRLKNLPHYVEIQVSLYFLTVVTRKYQITPETTAEEYIRGIQKDAERLYAFENYVGASGVADLTPIEVFNLFVSRYVLRMFEDVNISRAKLKEILSLYPECLNYYVPQAIYHMAKFFKIGYNEAGRYVVSPLNGEMIYFSETTDSYLFLLILQQYWNSRRIASGFEPESIIDEADAKSD